MHTPGTIKNMENITDINNTNHDQPVEGLHINSLNYVFITALLLLSTLLLLISIFLYSEYNEGSAIADEYHQIEIDSRNVQSASDYLTKSVQYFVLTGEKAYLDDYFEEADVTKRRENAIEDLRTLKNVDSLINLLEKSVHESKDLMLLEYEAMRYAAEGYGMDLSTLPEVIQKTSLPTKAASMSNREKIDYSREIIFGPEYKEYKDRIALYVSQYLELASSIMDKLKANGRQDMTRLLMLQRLSIGAIAVLGIVLFIAIAQLVVYPLRHAVQLMAEGEKITPLEGTYEIRYMSNTYNRFHSNSVAVQKRLKRDAEKDELTGVLNRRGYRTVVERLSLESFPIALLIVDIDHFKAVNDTYGHSTGDQALIKVSHLLLATFRNTDITSRIGGDEFTVILAEVTPENKAAIEKKVNRLNEILQCPGSDGIPKLSISVGCAFSDSGYTQQLFNEADSKMYESKDSGGGKITFA